ncbi:unnamed protein product [Mesocestoides corti]|uniref:SCHIP-1 domain-containing protein n=1 Tax=Mesocestoides corti TaxID=53468 RepID=A0A0R3UFL7_MESCO|nr:unnamed protein product [Mesocestoides corti]
MHHNSLAAIGRSVTIEAQDSLSESSEDRSSKESFRSAERVSAKPESSSQRIFRLDELLMHLKDVDQQLRELHTTKELATLKNPISASQFGQEVSPENNYFMQFKCYITYVL